MGIILECKNVYKTYHRGEEDVHALCGINLSVEQGTFTMLTGASGSGKSTLLHCIAGVDQPDSGNVFVGGQDIHALSPHDSAVFRRRKIGLIYQFFNLLPTLTARQNILLPLSLDGREPDKDYFDELVRTIGIQDRLDHYPAQMSGGQQQRCAIARALIAKPDLCLADEPTGNLDRKNTDETMELLKEARVKFGQTIIMVTHDQRLTEFCDRVIEMTDGKIISDVPAKSVGGN